jgi:hypothetical protein
VRAMHGAVVAHVHALVVTQSEGWVLSGV